MNGDARTEQARTVTVRYWAAARDATGVDVEPRSPSSVGTVLDAACADHPELADVLHVASLLLDGVRVDREAGAPPGSVLEVLPPFAGG